MSESGRAVWPCPAGIGGAVNVTVRRGSVPQTQEFDICKKHLADSAWTVQPEAKLKRVTTHASTVDSSSAVGQSGWLAQRLHSGAGTGRTPGLSLGSRLLWSIRRLASRALGTRMSNRAPAQSHHRVIRMRGREALADRLPEGPTCLCSAAISSLRAATAPSSEPSATFSPAQRKCRGAVKWVRRSSFDSRSLPTALPA
jgi:hypothetical protein